MCLIMRLRAPSRIALSRLCATSATSFGHSSTRSISLTLSRDGRRRGRFGFRMARIMRGSLAELDDVSVPKSAEGHRSELTDASVPKFAAGCRWGGTSEVPVVLFPEGTIRVEGTGRIILEL